MFFELYVADYELSCLQLLTSVSRDFKNTLTKKNTEENVNHPHVMPV